MISNKSKIHLQSALTFLVCCFVLTPAFAATVIVSNVNAPGEGFNDPTPATPVTGNPETTIGAQRLAAFQAAADEWAAMLVSPITIVIEAQMTSLPCTQNSAILGSAGPRGNVSRDFAEAPSPNTWYPQALVNSLRGVDSDLDDPDVGANFNQDIGTSGCLQSLGWSYVIGVPAPPGTIPFTDTVIHEIGHGLGFLTFVNSSTGAQLADFPDHYSQYLLDETPTPTLWNNLTNEERIASAIDTGQLTWSGPEVANVAGLLSAGRHPSSNRVRMYAPNPLQGGSSVSHFDTVLTPNEIMEPSLQTPNEKRLTNHLMLDIGWLGLAGLSVDIDDSQTSLTAGSPTTYVITLTNNGPADMTIVDATVTNTMPAALQSISWTCGGTGGATCSAASGSSNINTTVTLPLDGTITFNVDATINVGFTGTLTNTVSVELPANIQNSLPSSDSDNTTVLSGAPDPGITVSAISGNTTEAGGTATFSVVLDAQPASDVSIGLSSSDTGEGTPSVPSLTFTDANWNTPKIVTVTGVNDDIDDGNILYSIITAAASSGDGDYNGLNPADVSVTNLDDDTRGISVSAISGNTSEAGATATFNVVLTSEPTSDVSVGLSSSDPGEGTLSDASLTFTSVNWATAQEVTVTGVNDAVDDGDIAFSVITAPATSADGLYNGFNAADVNVTNLDDDLAGISVSALSGNTTEAGETATFTVVLNSEPTADVTVGLSSSNPGEATVSDASLTFTSVDWATAQEVTVTGVDDDLDDGDVAFSIITAAGVSADGNYSGINPDDPGALNIDDDTAGVNVSAISGDTSEAGGTATFTVVLTSEPTADVTIGLSSSDTGEGTVSDASLTFTSGNWNSAQEVTVTGIDDDLGDGNVDFSIVTTNTSSADGNYQGLIVADVSVTNLDDDTVGITVSDISGDTSESGSTATFTVVLNTEPTADVSIGLSSSDTSEGTLSDASLTFTTDNWATAREVTVTGVDDDVDDGDIAFTIETAAAISTDDKYNGIDAADISVTNIDDETAGITASTISGNTSESGGSALFSVSLASEPLASVTIGISSNDTTEGTVSTSSLTFTAGDWDSAQQVTVMGVDDDIDDGNIDFLVVTDPATSADPAYGGFNANDVSVTNTDDDASGITVSAISGDTTEAGGTATFTVVLQSEPTADVSIGISSSNTDEGVPSEASLVFSSANWDTQQEITVTGVDDEIDDGDVEYSILTAAASSADGKYDGVDPDDVSVTNLDDDLPNVIFEDGFETETP